MNLARLLKQRTLRRCARRMAPFMAGVFAWSFTAGPICSAYANAPRPVGPKGHVRRLSAAECERIVGGIVLHGATASVDSGTAYPWEGDAGGTNTFNGNKKTSIPIVSWTQRGGLPISLVLSHNSLGNHNYELGSKWTHSLDIYAMVNGVTGDVTVHWGDDQSIVFTKNINGSYSAPAGIHDTLVANGSPITSYDLTTKDQVRYRFTTPNGSFYCTSITDRNGNAATLSYNSNNYITSVQDCTGRTLTFTYSLGRLSSVTDPLSRTWSFATSGPLSQITYPTVGGSTYTESFGYNAANDITSITDRRGHTAWSATYNGNDSIASETDACSNTTTFTYNTNQTVITDANSHTVKHNYTSGKLTSVEDQAGVSESYSYDSDLNRTGITDRRGHSSSFTFDSAGNVLTKTDPLSHVWTWTYNSKNEVLTATDPLGNYVSNSYDTPGNLTQTLEKNGGGTTLATTTFAYDAGNHGLLVTKTDDNSHATTYAYDSNGHMTSTTTPNSKTTSWTVNGLGARTSRTDALSNTTNYTLDNWLRVTAVDYPTGTDPTFSYDANSNLTGWTDGVGTWARTFDNDNRMLTESLGGTTRLTNTYDGTGKKGLLATVTDANSRVITYAYNSRNLLDTLTENSASTTYSYDANGNETGITLPNTATVTKVYDNADRLTSITNKNSSSTTLSSFSYTYNNDNRRATCTESNGDVVSWSYDAQGHMTAESRTGSNSYSASYTVDGVGNRTSQTIGTKTTSFTLNSDDALTATSSSTGGFVNSYSYNNAGDQTNRTLSGTSWTLAYDYEGQLTSTATGGSTVSTFVYDALGRRYSRANGGTTTVFYYGPGGIVLEKQGSTFTSAYAYGNGLIRKDGEYPLFDGLGSERTVTNGSQTVTGTINHDAFGLTVNTTGSSTNPYKFAATSGYRDDGDAGLVHVGARYYDSQVGRFITRDTYLDQKPYLYCEHDPVNHLDPSGNAPEHVDLGWILGDRDGNRTPGGPGSLPPYKPGDMIGPKPSGPIHIRVPADNGGGADFWIDPGPPVSKGGGSGAELDIRFPPRGRVRFRFGEKEKGNISVRVSYRF